MNLYLQLVKMVWKMYNQCHLVHADLSEYNLLYHKKKLYIIDVSQSVEHDHPHSSEFLRKDCSNVIDYFRKKVQHPIFTLREMFEFVIKDAKTIRESMDPEEVKNIDNDDDLIDLYLVKFHESIRDRPENYNEIHKVDEEVFKKSYIPRNLDEVIDIQRDVDMVESGKLNDLIYSNIVGINAGPKKEEENINRNKEENNNKKNICTNSENIKGNSENENSENENSGNENSENENSENESSENEDEIEDVDEEEEDYDDKDDDDQGRSTKSKKLKKYEDKEAKKERKKQMKEEKREKRKNKIPKSVKKRKQKISTEKGKSKGKKKI